jgi:ADP-ribose pyrophosphatase
MVNPWRVVESHVQYEDPWLKVRTDQCVRDDGQLIGPYHVLEYPAWVNVVALTSDGEIILAREYRHGVQRVITGLPCGSLEKSDDGPTAAARRELREETGYDGGQLVALGASFANPASHTNMIYGFLAVGVSSTCTPHPELTEQIEIVRVAFPRFFRDAVNGSVILHCAHLATLYAAARHIARSQAPELRVLQCELIQQISDI